MLNLLTFFGAGVCGMGRPNVPGESQHIQHIQGFKGFGADMALKFTVLRGLERLMPPNPLKC